MALKNFGLLEGCGLTIHEESNFNQNQPKSNKAGENCTYKGDIQKTEED